MRRQNSEPDTKVGMGNIQCRRRKGVLAFGRGVQDEAFRLQRREVALLSSGCKTGLALPVEKAMSRAYTSFSANAASSALFSGVGLLRITLLPSITYLHGTKTLACTPMSHSCAMARTKYDETHHGFDSQQRYEPETPMSRVDAAILQVVALLPSTDPASKCAHFAVKANARKAAVEPAHRRA